MEKNGIVFVWENFGPIHRDRCEASAVFFDGKYPVIGVELFGRSHTYDWRSESSKSFAKYTLFQVAPTRFSTVRILFRLFSKLLKLRPHAVFLCHYEQPYIFLAALILRLFRFDVFIMNDSKFDDYKRYLFREIGKAIMYVPYKGALVSGIRSKDYLRFLGFSDPALETNYNVMSIKRIVAAAGSSPAPLGIEYSKRHFTIIARLVPKKNIAMALKAYRAYRDDGLDARPLHICGDGPLMAELVKLASDLSITENVIFHGFLQTEQISEILSSTLALILPSLEEQFGNVVIEAQAMGLPVLLSENCGARDLLIRSGVNGFVFEPDNAKGLAYFMNELAANRDLWVRMSTATQQFVGIGGVEQFPVAVQNLMTRLQRKRATEPLA